MNIIVAGMSVAMILSSTWLTGPDTNGPDTNGPDTNHPTVTRASAPPAEAALLPPSKDGPRVQIALLLDTSSSMSGLIDQARTQLWKVAGEFTRADKDGRIPLIEIALYEYGNSGLSKEDGWIRQVMPLTDDLDRVSERLFALTTIGGEEYCGQVIDHAVTDLKWTDDKNAYKVIYIAGNEPFTQGTVRWQDSVKKAISKGIMVNTVHCGDEQQGANSGWKDGALMADGQYLAIDQNRQVAHIAAPQDKAIAELGVKLNDTYVPYGRQGVASVARQEAQDNNVASSAGSTVQRAVYKSTANYMNDSWDLVDALDNGRVALKDVKKDDLPEAMRGMSADEQTRYLEKKRTERKALQAKIKTLNDAREAFVTAERKRQADASGVKTLDQAMIESMRRQASKNGYNFH